MDTSNTPLTDIVPLLVDVGYNEKLARTINRIGISHGITARELEYDLKLRQPEISLLLSHLTAEGLVSVTTRQPMGRGRPEKVYLLSHPLDTILYKKAHERLSFLNDEIRRLEQITGILTSTTSP